MIAVSAALVRAEGGMNGCLWGRAGRGQRRVVGPGRGVGWAMLDGRHEG